MVGGDREDLDSIGAIVECFSSRVIHMGPLGSGLRAKLARNLIQYGSWLAAYEGQLVAQAAGIPLAKLALAVRESDAKIGGASALMIRDTADPFDEGDDPALVQAMALGFELADKDLRAIIDLGDQLGVATPVARMTHDFVFQIFGEPYLGGRSSPESTNLQ